jgi:multidrug resistance protein, MATE family
MTADAASSPRLPHSRADEARALVKLALPIAIAQAGQALMGFVDTVVVGRAGTSALAAVGLANMLFFAVSGFGIGMMAGLDPLVSQAFVALLPGRARALLWQGGYLAVGLGLALAVPILLAPALLPLFGVAPAELAQVRGYLLLRAPSLPLVFLYFSTRSYLQAAAITRPLVVATVVANLFNLGADIVLVFGGGVLPAWAGPLRLIPALGAKGAAIATTLCCIVQWAVVALAVRLVPAPEQESGRPRRRLHLPDLRQAARVGLPIGLHIGAEIGVFALAGLLSARFGPASVSAHQIAISFASLTFTVAMGIGNAGSVRVGWAVGAHDTRQARQSGFVAFAAGAGFMTLSGLFFALFPEPLARAAGAPPDVLALAAPLLMVSAVFQVSDGVQGVGAGVLRGAGEAHFTFLANMVGHYAIGLPVALLLGFVLGLGVVGIWWGLCVGLTAVALALLWRFHRVSAGTIRPLDG